jgi:hypothetical protein
MEKEIRMPYSEYEELVRMADESSMIRVEMFVEEWNAYCEFPKRTKTTMKYKKALEEIKEIIKQEPSFEELRKENAILKKQARAAVSALEDMKMYYDSTTFKLLKRWLVRKINRGA